MKSLLIVSAIATGLFIIARAIAEEPHGQKSESPRRIPFSEIVTTSPQEGLHSVREALEQRNPQLLETADDYLRKALRGLNGSSNVILVEATTIHEAVSASYGILNGARSADIPAPVNVPDPPRGNHWLVAYLGIGPSNPTWWTIESVAVNEGKIRLNYQKASPMSANRDLHRYCYWIPLGKLDVGTYALELFDTGKGTVTLMRRVEVAQID